MVGTQHECMHDLFTPNFAFTNVLGSSGKNVPAFEREQLCVSAFESQCNLLDAVLCFSGKEMYFFMFAIEMKLQRCM